MGAIDDVAEEPPTLRGISQSRIRAFTCKDCQREVERLEAALSNGNRKALPEKEEKRLRSELENCLQESTYNERIAEQVIERGGTRSDRCREHQVSHKKHIQGIAVAYIDLETVGEVSDRQNPTGPLGGLGPLPESHNFVEGTSYPLDQVKVGMTDDHIIEMVEKLRDKRVLILKAGTGTGKSTFAPYRLMDPPQESIDHAAPNSPFRKLTDLGQIVVTEPRRQAAIGVAEFVGGTMSGAGKLELINGKEEMTGGFGAGFPVGYQVSRDRNHDASCELVYVTDGTMINWLREGRLSRIGTVIVDEAHERSTNIDFIMGYLKKELDRYPHLRVIVTSATFNTDFYQEFFGGPEVAHVMDIAAAKSFGYGMPLFPSLDSPANGEEQVFDEWSDTALALVRNSDDDVQFIRRHWEEFGPPLEAEDVVDNKDVGWIEPVWETTAKLIDLRFQDKIGSDKWQEDMPATLASFVVDLAQGLDEAEIFGDILGFLPTTKSIEQACEEIKRSLGREYAGHVFPLIASLPEATQKRALEKRRKGEPRKIVISTNLAETSLTVEGVRFVVDSGLIAQSYWDPVLADGGVSTTQHSRSGIRQRWGRVGRKAPGWVFPLYTKGQFLELAEDTPPGSSRENLESLVMTAKMGGVDNIEAFDWPGAFEPTTTQLDETADAARITFDKELSRANKSLQQGGALDQEGDPTQFGKELAHFKGLGSTASALALLYADRLACVSEVATILALLEDTRLVGQDALLRDDRTWPDEWRLEAAQRHQALAALCEDDAHLVLLIMAAWERSDPNAGPTQNSSKRQAWCREWWISNTVLLNAAEQRQDILGSFSPRMGEEVKRPTELALLDRARGVISRSIASHRYVRTSQGFLPANWRPEPDASSEAALDDSLQPPAEHTFAEVEEDRLALFAEAPDDVVALRRREFRETSRISNLLACQTWAASDDRSQQPTGVADAMQMILAAAEHASPRPEREQPLAMIDAWPIGLRIQASTAIGDDGAIKLESLQDDTLRPFPCPTINEQRTKSKRSRRPRNSQSAAAESADTATDLGLIGGRQGFEDEDQIRARAVAEADSAAEASASCGSCFNCIAGREEECSGLDVPTGQGENPKEKWEAAIRQCGDDHELTVRVLEQAPHDWYEVVSYHIDDDGYTVSLAPDWRPAGGTANPAQHQNVSAGETVRVTVGPASRHHGGPVRVFHRADGKGRFVLGEARSPKGKIQESMKEIAASLGRGTRGLVEGLSAGTDRAIDATVVPARVEGCYTITLLELLHQHISKGVKEFHVVENNDRTTKRPGLRPAVVAVEPNDMGWGTAALLHQDVSLGIKHLFDFKVAEHASPSEPTSSQPAPDRLDDESQAPATLESGTPLLLHLVQDQARLDVEDFPLGELRHVEGDSAGGLRLELPRKNRRRRSSAEQNEAENPDEPTPHGTVLVSVSVEPLSRHNARALINLDDSHEWRNEVWSFWARSHHLQTDKKHPYILGGSDPSVIDYEASVEVDDENRIAKLRAVVSEFARHHTLNTVIEAPVLRTEPHQVTVSLGEGLEGTIPISELAWGFTEHVADEARAGQTLRALLTRIDEETPKIELSVKALLPDPYILFKQTHSVGTTVSGIVRSMIVSRVFLELGEAVEGSIHVGELAYVEVGHPSDVVTVGETIKAQIKGFDDARKQAVLSIKATLQKPIETFEASHPPGTQISGTARKVTKTHVYVDLDYGAKGAVYVGDLSHIRDQDARAVVKEGDEIIAEVKGFEYERSQVELSIKALLPRPLDEYRKGHKQGDAVEGIVRLVTSGQVIVDLGQSVEGVVPRGDVAYGDVDDARTYLQQGQQIRARIMGFNDKQDEVKLSRKALMPEPFQVFKSKHSINDTVTGVINGTSQHFAFVNLEGGATGAIHVSQLAPHRVETPEEFVSEGQQIAAVITAFDEGRKQVKLSLKQATQMMQPSTPERTARPTPRPRPIAPQSAPPPRPATKRTATAEGPSVEEAHATAAASLGLSPSQVIKRVIRTEKKGLFRGLTQTAVVEVTER